MTTENADVRPAAAVRLGPFADELFARGYILSEQSPSTPEHWVKRRFDDLHVAHDPRLSFHGHDNLVCLGLIFDVRFPSLSAADRVASLARSLGKSEDAFFAELAYTSGRYVIAYRTGGRCYLITDAGGMKGAFYGGGFVSSHMNLTGWQFGAAARPPVPARFGYPGLRTPLHGVSLLTPNTKLDLSTMQPVRYWPLEPITQRSCEDCAEEVAEWFRASATHLAERHKLLVSITAGIDSRVTLAAFEGLSFDTFTYYRSDAQNTDKQDLAYAAAIRDRFGLKHLTLQSANTGPVPKEFRALCKMNTHYQHQPWLSWEYYKLYHASGVLHVRSNLAEIGRQFWQKRCGPLQSADDMLRAWRYSGVQARPEQLAAFEEFAEVTKILDAPVSAATLFYWEHRMAQWHSQVVAESDPAFDTLSLFNCRALLTALLSVSDDDQRNATAFKSVVHRLWPALTEYDVNGAPFAAYS